MNNLKNKVQLIGNLGGDPESKKLNSGKVITKISLATNDMYTNTQGEKVTETQWHKVIAWGKTAEKMDQLLKKGSEVALAGKLTHRSYTDDKGNTRYITEVVVNEFMLLNRGAERAS